MAKIILDFGSGNTNKNDWNYTKRMIDELKSVDTGKHEVIIKWQIFENAGQNIPLSRPIFNMAYNYAEELGYKTTASVFDKLSLDYLLEFDPCFVKIANNRKLDWLIGEIPRKIPIYQSIGNQEEYPYLGIYEEEIADIFQNIYLTCISEYPADIKNYEKQFNNWLLRRGISDHTSNFDLWHKYQPRIIEWHYKLEDSYGLDAGSFARTPAQLAEVL